MELIFASHNQNKVFEINAIVGEQFVIKSLSDIGYHHDIIEDGLTLEENALIKARTIYKHTQKNCFADDTGLLVEALNNEPGVHSARYAGPQKNDKQNIELLLKNLEAQQNKKACFTTVIALIFNHQEYLFTGQLNGQITSTEAGTNGFGYDPVFMPENYNITLAQMSLTEKNAISHRAIAFNKLAHFLKTKV
jgi:XTP/dITP diphosphohydrolase